MMYSLPLTGQANNLRDSLSVLFQSCVTSHIHLFYISFLKLFQWNLSAFNVWFCRTCVVLVSFSLLNLSLSNFVEVFICLAYAAEDYDCDGEEGHQADVYLHEEARLPLVRRLLRSGFCSFSVRTRAYFADMTPSDVRTVGKPEDSANLSEEAEDVCEHSDVLCVHQQVDVGKQWI